jgi:hypothetical protein
MDGRKIAVTKLELVMIVSALIAYSAPTLAERITERFEAADSANDGPEVEILTQGKPCSL